MVNTNASMHRRMRRGAEKRKGARVPPPPPGQRDFQDWRGFRNGFVIRAKLGGGGNQYPPKKQKQK